VTAGGRDSVSFMSLFGFDLVDEHALGIAGVTARRYRHQASQAELLHLASDEPNLSFAVAFPTLPSDDTGVAHILEHMVLAGSERFPLKDPFFEMIKGSLAGFLNAFTYPDRTVYPFATENRADFLNLLDVYLDAVFKPRLSRTTFDQEAWHFERDEDTRTLSLHGVVFNEMKGAFGDPGRSLSQAESESLFRDTPYRYESGGDPSAIPDLTYANLVDFHRRNYHPSRARFVLHGPVPLEATLERIEQYLSGSDPHPAAEFPPLQSPYAEPLEAEGTYPADAHGQSLAAVSWAFPTLEGPGESLALDVLDHVLVGTPASPLRRALLDAGLGEAFLGGLDTSLRQPVFRAGLRGVAPERTTEVHQLVRRTLSRLADEGLDPADVRAARNRLEFELREMDGHGGQRGLSLAISAIAGWLHGRDPIRELDYDAALEDLNLRLGQGEDHGAAALTGLLRTVLVENTHSVATRVLPDAEWSEKRNAQERDRLEQQAAMLGDEDLRAIDEAASLLRKVQQEPDSAEAKATLPRLKREDLQALRPDPVCTEEMHAGSVILHVNLPTRGLVYINAGFDLRHVPTEHLFHVGMLGRYLLETGTAKRSLAELSRAIDGETGGIDAGHDLAAPAPNGAALARFFVRGRALASKAGDVADLMREIVLEARLDDVMTLKTLARESLARRRAALERAGHRYAIRRLAAHDSAEARAEEAMTGLASLEALAAFVERCEREPDQVVSELEALRASLLTRSNLVIGLTADDDAATQALPALRGFIEGLPDGPSEAQDWSFDAPGMAEGWTLPGQVNYVATSRSLTKGTEVPGSWLVANRWLSSEVLLPKIRFEGGAYGAGSMIDPLRGGFRTYSYRDPNLQRTLDIVAEASTFLREAADTLDEVELETLVIGAVGNLDPYDPPSERGYRALVRWLRGTQEQPARLRREILATSRAAFTELADALESAGTPEVVVLGPTASLQAADASLSLSIRSPG